jgi:hypothetical protein
MTEWRPIGTAPHDRLIRLLCRTPNQPTVLCECEGRYVKDVGGWAKYVDDSNQGLVDPVLWAPIEAGRKKKARR